jgi:hypothetical protein
MGVEFKAVEAIDSLVALLRVAEDSAVHSWEQDEAFHPGIFPGLILLARFASQRAGEEFKQAVVAAELNRWNTNLQGERDQLQQQLAQVTAERDAARQKELEKHVEWASFYNRLQANLNTIKAELGAARKQVAELTKKLRELPPETAPEPYDWQVGDDIECNGVTRRKVIDRRDGWVFLEGVTSPLSQPEWERRRWKLYRKAADLPDIQPSTPQQVAEFAAVTEPIDDSTGAGEGREINTHAPPLSSLNWVRYQPDEHQLREGRQYMAAFRDFDEHGNSLPFEFVVVTPHYDENGILSLDVGDAEVEPTEVLFVALLEDSTGADGEGQS